VDVLEELARIRANHDKDQPGAIRDLRSVAKSIATAEQSSRFAALVNHVVGLEGDDWKLASELTRDLAGRTEFERVIRLQGSLAVACYASGQWRDGIRAEGLALAAAGDSALAALVWIRCSAGEALVRRQERETLSAFLLPALRIAGTLEAVSDFDKAIASTTNNIASTLLELPERGAWQDELLEQTARTSRRFWQRAGTWENHERADYLLALTYNALGRYDAAEAAALRALATIDQNGEEPVDRAFINVELAYASKQLGKISDFTARRDQASHLAAAFSDQSLKSWFDQKFSRLN